MYMAYLSTERPIRNEVTVVPMLAPRTMPAACDRFIRPARTRPIVMAMDAELDCMIIVMMIPITECAGRVPIDIEAQFIACSCLQAVAHELYAEHEQAEAAENHIP